MVDSEDDEQDDLSSAYSLTCTCTYSDDDNENVG
jgi:hypothetical protein